MEGKGRKAKGGERRETERDRERLFWLADESINILQKHAEGLIYRDRRKLVLGIAVGRSACNSSVVLSLSNKSVCNSFLPVFSPRRISTPTPLGS